MNMRVLAAVLLLALPFSASAVLYRWVDEKGKVTYSDQAPPPNARKVEEKKLKANVVTVDKQSYGARKAESDFPVTLYTGQGCGKGCDEARTYLGKRGVPFTEKALLTKDDEAAYHHAIDEGPLFVPALTVGSQKLKGYDKALWDKLLDDVGYPRGAAKP